MGDYAMSRKVHITTLGCSKNEVDSDVLKGQLKQSDFELVDDPSQSDTIIINTCGFIEAAKEESIDAIMDAVSIKSEHPNTTVFVAGCLSARYRDELKAEIPEVDAFFGTEDYQNILHSLDSRLIFDAENQYVKRDISSDHHVAYLKISEGCNHTCAFCAIPGMRGKHRSRPIESIVREAEMLALNGCKELILIAQDSTYYGRDIYHKPKLAALLQALEQVDGIEWIRVMYMYPLSFPMDVIDVMAASTKICRYVDIPIQGATDHLLTLMRRGTKKSVTLRILDRLREAMPDISLRTTLIVGHPGESEADIDETIAFLQDYRFNRLGVFTYSDEDGTTAAALPNRVDESVKLDRMSRIMSIQQTISESLNSAFIGQTMDVIIDRFNSESMMFHGRTRGDAPDIDNEVIISHASHIQLGDIIPVQVHDANAYELFANPLPQS